MVFDIQSHGTLLTEKQLVEFASRTKNMQHYLRSLGYGTEYPVCKPRNGEPYTEDELVELYNKGVIGMSDVL